ncbi:MAG: Gfo/Idh/MocA family oxidoreductase, partial [Pirellulales bacterium]|nr:Gfo/Idh/MocA family oxidoreductase [Pirellulales bacterium]
MSQPQLGVAIHGAGWVGGAHAASWQRLATAQIISISDVNLERAGQLAARLGLDCAVRDKYEQVLADPRVDVVDITGPSHVHAEQAIAAAEAGKHVHVEKPIALTVEENRRLRDAVLRAGVKSQAGFVVRFSPEVQLLKSLVEKGTVGDIFYAELDYWHTIRPTHHAWNLHSRRATGGSAMLLGGCHALDAMRFLVGDEVVEVTAYGNNQRGNFEYDANVVAVFRFRGGAIGKTAALFDAAMPYQFNIDLVGTEGTLRDNRIWSPRLLPGQTGWATVPTIMLDTPDVNHHPFDAELGYFADCILNDRQSHCSV